MSKMKAGRPSRSKPPTSLSDLVVKPEMVRVNFDLDKESHTNLKVYAAKKGQSITDILRELINSILIEDL